MVLRLQWGYQMLVKCVLKYFAVYKVLQFFLYDVNWFHKSITVLPFLEECKV